MNQVPRSPTVEPTISARQWWRAAPIGYLVTLVLTIGALLIPWSERTAGIHDFFIAPPFVLVTLFIAWVWGMGPALLALVIEVGTLDYLIIPPLRQISFFAWPELASFGPFILIQFVALALILRQKHYRQQILATNEALERSVAELLEINAQLEQANRVRETFVSQASHELKTPLTSLQGLVQWTLRRLHREPPLSSTYAFLPTNLERMETQTRRLRQLVEDLLEASYLHDTTLLLHLAPCDLCQVCRDVLEELSFLLDREVELHLPSEQVVVSADETRLSQVLSNLLTNALQYSPADCKVQITIRASSQDALIAVHNDGSFLPPEQLARIFDPFYRAPEVWCSAQSGWGLGLTMSRLIVERHSGQIWVESSQQMGTTFFVALPWDLPPH